MRYFLIVLLINFCGLQAQEISTATSFNEQSFDVLQYDALVDLTAQESTSVNGMNEITFVWTKEENRNFYFHLQDLEIDSVFYNGVEVSPSKQYITNPGNYYYSVPAIDEKDTVFFSVYYHGDMTGEGGNFDWGGVHFEENILYALGVGFYNEYVSATRHWLPCYDHPSDKAYTNIEFITDTNKTVASGGILIEDTVKNGKRHLVYENKDLIATYLMTFAESEYEVIEDEYNGIPIEIYTKIDDLEESGFVYQNVPKMIECYENYFGDYPFGKAGYVNTVKGAMEHQTMVSIPESVISSSFNNKDSNNLTVAHELAHQWFGDKVSPLDFKHAWINESIATFSESLYLEYIRGKNDYISDMRANWGRYKNATLKNEGDLPLYYFQSVEGTSNYPETIYNKGAVVMQMLRFQLGDDAFFSGLKNILKHENYTTDMLMNTFETGIDIEGFFDQWIYNNGFPKVNIEVREDIITEGPNAYPAIAFKVTQDTASQAKVFENVFFNIQVTVKNAESPFTFLINMNQAEEEFKFRFEPDFEDISYISGNSGPDVIALLDVDNIDIITSVEDNSKEEYRIYPNPAQNTISVSGLSAGTHYSIFDNSGRMISEGMYNESIDISSLPSSHYFLRIKSPGGVSILRFDVLR